MPQCVCVRARVCECVQACVGMDDVACNYKTIVTTLSRLQFSAQYQGTGVCQV